MDLHPWVQAIQGLTNVPAKVEGAVRALEAGKAIGRGLLDVAADALGIGLIKTIVETGYDTTQALRGRVEAMESEIAAMPSKEAMENDILRLLGGLSRRSDVPVLVVSLDDLQWADAATTAVCAALSRASTQGWKLLFILGFRDNEVDQGKCPFAATVPAAAVRTLVKYPLSSRTLSRTPVCCRNTSIIPSLAGSPTRGFS